MKKTTVHLINHTHWDREWFLTSIYTSRWIPRLIDKLVQLVADNPGFQFLFDGQTLVIEDLIQVAPAYKGVIEKLVEAGNLLIGPYYCQPDWQLAGGETLVRNLLYGRLDVGRYGGKSYTGWLVDTFGHISQTPQLHRLAGVESVYVWRGVPRLEPYFRWQGADSSELFTVNLFGGYRNLYGVTHVPEVAVTRLQAEERKLRPFYPTADIPLFDGYDLEDNPEDPMRFFQERPAAIPSEIQLKESSPKDFAQTMSEKITSPPVIYNELNSGKYGATFPGTLSARTYLKIMHRDCEHLLYQVCEPLAVLARCKGRAYPSSRYESWARGLLQNAVHDCLAGVSIDQVHEKMEFSYRQLFKEAQEDIRESLAAVLSDFAPGTYAVSTNPFGYSGWKVIENECFDLRTDGIGVWPVGEGSPVESLEEPASDFEWQNAHYSAAVERDGSVRVGEARLGLLLVSEEKGDTYSDEAGRRKEYCRPQEPPVIVQKSDAHCVLRCRCDLSWEDVAVSAEIQLIFDQSPLIRWQVDLDSRGVDFQVDLVFETALKGDIYAGMPFDVVKRPLEDRDLLPRQLEPELASVLLGQRELEAVKTFPFQEFVAVSNGTTTAAILAKGLRSYQAEENGRFRITLRRSVEWLTKPDLKHREGDAGPFFYVPDARCERAVSHELGVIIGSFDVHDLDFHRINAGFQNPPLVGTSTGGGQETEWLFLTENLPVSGQYLDGDKVLTRFYNPTRERQLLNHAYTKTDLWGRSTGVLSEIGAKEIVTAALERPLPPIDNAGLSHSIRILHAPNWRVGVNQGLPDMGVVAELKERMSRLQGRLDQITAQRDQATLDKWHRLQHQYYMLARELYELRLSARLNAQKWEMQGRLTAEYLYKPDAEIAEIGLQLNQLRIKRRIYDYVVQAL